jgi:hypothetical protein
LGEHTFGLFDDDPATQRDLELFADGLAAVDRSFLKDSDGGDVGIGLT